MRKSLPALMAALLLFSVPAAGAVEYFTDVTVQERAVVPSAPAESAQPDENTQRFVIENAAVVETGPADDSYVDLARGDSGDAVLRMQARLIQLGYLVDPAPDGTCGKNTCAAMHDFKVACGIDDPEPHAPEDCPADAQAQAMLFSDAAVPYNDPVFPVEIVADAGIRAKEQGDSLVFSPTVRNLSHTRTLASVTLSCYAADLWGNRSQDESLNLTWTTAREIAPGAEIAVDAATLPQRGKITWLYAAVTEISFTDGTSVRAEAPVYVGWTPLKW